MKARANATPLTRTTAAALELVARLEADLREIQYRLSQQVDAGEEFSSREDNQDLNTIQKEVRLFLNSLTEATA